MAKLKPGDRVDCRIKSYAIVSPYDPDYDEVKTFEIVSKDKTGYHLYIPGYLFLKNTVEADSYLCRKLQIHHKFLGEQILYVKEGMILKVNTILDGCVCIQCQDFYYWAEPNQWDSTFICWSCRKNPYR
jgi:hypothetical protein